MAAAAVVAPTDDYSADSLELARAAEALQVVAGRLQARLAADRRTIVAERAVLALEREAVREDHERAARAVSVMERASAALEQVTMLAAHAAPASAEQVLAVSSGTCDAVEPEKIQSSNVPPRPKRSPPLVKDPASPRAQLEVSPMPVDSATVTPTESQPSGASPAARCKEPPAYIKHPLVLLDNRAGSEASSGGSLLLSDNASMPPGIRSPKSPPAVPEVSLQVPASMPILAHPPAHAAVDSAADAVAWCIEDGQSMKQQDDAVLDGLAGVDDDIADFDGPPAKSPPPQSPFYRVMPAPKPKGSELAAVLPPPASVPAIGIAEEGLVPTKAMPARCMAMPKPCPSGPPPVAVSIAAVSPTPQHKGRHKAPPAELARQLTDSERLAETKSGASLVTTARVKAPPIAATARVKAAPTSCPAKQDEQSIHEGDQQRGPAQVRTKAFPSKPRSVACGRETGEP